MTVLVCVNKALRRSSGALCATAVSLNWQELAQEADATGSLILATSE